MGPLKYACAVEDFVRMLKLFCKNKRKSITFPLKLKYSKFYFRANRETSLKEDSGNEEELQKLCLQ